MVIVRKTYMSIRSSRHRHLHTWFQISLQRTPMNSRALYSPRFISTFMFSPLDVFKLYYFLATKWICCTVLFFTSWVVERCTLRPFDWTWRVVLKANSTSVWLRWIGNSQRTTTCWERSFLNSTSVRSKHMFKWRRSTVIINKLHRDWRKRFFPFKEWYACVSILVHSSHYCEKFFFKGFMSNTF